MTSDTVPAPQAQAIWGLVAAMTRWEPLTARAANIRLQKTGTQLGLLSQFGGPPAFPGLPPSSEAFVQTLATLRDTPLAIRRLALRSALEVALGSGTLPLAQNLALRTVVDALRLDSNELATLFFARTGTRLPFPWDPSDRTAWLAREAQNPNSSGPWDDSSRPLDADSPEENGRIVRIKAMAMLGLDEGASTADIKRAFLRISQVHHPDHYASLGPEASQEADRSFRRIKDAYEFLMKAEV